MDPSSSTGATVLHFNKGITFFKNSQKVSFTYVSVVWTAAAVAVVTAVVVVVARDVGGKVDRVATVTRSGSLGSSILPTISALTTGPSPSLALMVNCI